jgi:hypothetical protein
VQQTGEMNISAILFSTHSTTWPHILQKLIVVVVISGEYHWTCNVLILYPIRKTQIFSKHPLDWIPRTEILKLYTDNFNNNEHQGQYYYYYYYYHLWHCSPTWVMASSSMRFLDHTQRRATVSRTPLDEWSARRRDFYLTTHNRQTSLPPVGFETTIAAGERP